MIQHQLDADRPLGIGGGGPLIQSSGLLRFYTAHQAVISRVLNRHSLGKHHLNMSIVEMAGRESHSRSYDVYYLLHVLLRRFVVDPAGQRRLIDLCESHRVHQQVGQIVGRVDALTGNAAYAHIDKGLISREELGCAFTGYPHHLGHLDQHAARQLKRLILIHSAGFHIRLVERIHILVHTSDGHAGLILLYRKQGLDGPDRLDSFPEGFRLVCGNLGVDL